MQNRNSSTYVSIFSCWYFWFVPLALWTSCIHAIIRRVVFVDIPVYLFLTYIFVILAMCTLCILQKVAVLEFCVLSSFRTYYFWSINWSGLHLNCRDTLNMSAPYVGILQVSLWRLLVRTQSGCGLLVQEVKVSVYWAAMGTNSVHVFFTPPICLCWSLAVTRRVICFSICLYMFSFIFFNEMFY